MEFHLNYFKSWKMMLLKCCIQYVSKFTKLSSGHKTRKGHFSFQSQRRAMPKNDQTTTQLHSSHILAKKCPIFPKQGFTVHKPWTSRYSSWILKRQRNRRSNYQHQLDHRSSKRGPEKYLLLLHWLHYSLWLCGLQQTVEILQEMGIPDQLMCLLRNLYAGQETTVRTGHGTGLGTDWLQIRKGVCSRLYIVTLLI